MNLEQCKQKIDRYLRRKSEGVPLVVDVQNSDDQKALVEHYGSLNNALRLKASDYCAHDEMPRTEDILNDLLTKDATMIVTGVTAFLRLKGEDALRRFIDGLFDMKNIAGHAIFITCQCGEFLRNGDPRRGRLIAEVEGDAQAAPEIVFAPPGIPLPKDSDAVVGIEKFAEAVEGSSGGTVYVLTNKKKGAFQNSMYAIRFIEGAYDAISRKCKGGMPDESLGTDAEWSYALTLFEDKSSWEEVINATIGHTSALASIISGYKDFPDNKKWLCFIALKMFGVKNNEYLETVARQAKSVDEFITRAYRCLLDESPSDKDFWKHYSTRKQLLSSLGNPTEELSAYCSLALDKGIDAICYLTDATRREKEAVFEYLDRYGQDVNQDEMMERLQTVYPELCSYLSSTYCFGNELLNQYFDDYKWQKATNKIWPQFEAQVEALAKTRDYFGFLEPRDSVVEKLNREDSQLYFMDAMGVEYLSYIIELCHKLDLAVDITVCAAELPTITSRNKGFVELFAESGHETVSIKTIDDIKHEGCDSADFSKNSLPIYLIKELAAIRKALVNIKNELLNGAIKRAFMIADHGASRLAVLHNKENIWEMSAKGEHSGRCCPKSDVDEQPAFAVDAGDFWALANYDRFKGGRKAAFEVHGGAALEEVCVPVIELELKPPNLENMRVELMDADRQAGDGGVPVIEVSFNKRPELKIFLSGGSLQDISLEVNGKRYPAEDCGDGCYHIEMKGLKKGTYSAKVFAGDNPIGEPLAFVIKSKGMQEKDLL